MVSPEFWCEAAHLVGAAPHWLSRRGGPAGLPEAAKANYQGLTPYPDAGWVRIGRTVSNPLPLLGVCGATIRKQEGGPRGVEFRMADDRVGAWSN